MIFGMTLLACALWKKTELPESSALQAELLNEPAQMAISRPPKKVTVGEMDYTVQPLYTYDLYGMVVSKHNADTWWDFLHREWNDRLNITDLCVVWGSNMRSGAYRDINFSSGQFSCNFQTSSSEAWAAFDTTAISNNHLLSNDPGLARKMRDVRIGDQIHFSGYLAGNTRIIMDVPLAEGPVRYAPTPAMVHVKPYMSRHLTYYGAEAAGGTSYSGSGLASFCSD